VPHRHRPWAAGAGPGAVPRRGLLSLVWGTRLRHRAWPPERAGAGARSGRSPAGGTRRPLTVPHVADRPVFTRAFGRAGSPDCSAARGPDASCTVAARWEQFRAGCVAERSPQWTKLGGARRTRRGQKCGPEPGLPRRSSWQRGSRAAVAGGRSAVRTGPSQRGGLPPRARAASRVSRAAGGVLILGPGAAIRASQAAGGALTGPRPAPAAASGRVDRAPDDSDHASAGAAGRGLRADGSGAAGGLAGRGRTRHVMVCDQVRLCFGSIHSPAGRVRVPQSRCSTV
jgi:hypothetical protein